MKEMMKEAMKEAMKEIKEEEIKEDKMLLNIEESAKLLGVGKRMVRSMMKDPNCPLVYDGAYPKIVKPLILEFLKKSNQKVF